MRSNSFTVNDMARGCSRQVNYGHILTFRQESEWTGRCYEMTSGHALSSYCQGRGTIPAARRKTTGASSRPFSGYAYRQSVTGSAGRTRPLAPNIRALLALARERCLGAHGNCTARRCQYGALVYRLDHRSRPPAFRRRPKKKQANRRSAARGAD